MTHPSPGFAMQFAGPGQPLHRVDRPVPRPGPGEIVLQVLACGVCRTDLHVADGEVEACHPIVPGHEIVGRVIEIGAGVDSIGRDANAKAIGRDANVKTIKIGDRVGVPWLGQACGTCKFCRSGRENLCDDPVFTGATRDGGYASHVIATAAFCLPIPPQFSDVEAAPLLCAGLIGYRALRMAGEGRRLGLYGFGAAAHIVAQVAIWQGRDVHAFTRPGDTATQDFALSLGCTWAGGSDTAPPAPLDAAIIFAPVGELVPTALRALDKGGRVVCAGIHMTDIPSFPYADLWLERDIISVANLTRADGHEFLELAAKIPVTTTTTTFPMDAANRALDCLRSGELHGAAVLVPNAPAPSAP